MLVDIHTHNCNSRDNISVRNLSLTESDVVLSENEPRYFSLGIHPWEMDNLNSESMIKLMNYVSDSRVVAIGECGLDRNIKTPLENQIELFKKQIIISETIQKPLIIHCVGCFNELIGLKKSIKPHQKWIIHGFRGKPQLAQQLLKAGFNLSFGVQFNPESVKITPFEQLFIETDESVIKVSEIYSKIAILKDCSVSSLNAGYNLIFKKSDEGLKYS